MYPKLQGLRLVLAIQDAHELYWLFGYTSPLHPEWSVEIGRPGL